MLGFCPLESGHALGWGNLCPSRGERGFLAFQLWAWVCPPPPPAPALRPMWPPVTGSWGSLCQAAFVTHILALDGNIGRKLLCSVHTSHLANRIRQKETRGSLKSVGLVGAESAGVECQGRGRRGEGHRGTLLAPFCLLARVQSPGAAAGPGSAAACPACGAKTSD